MSKDFKGCLIYLLVAVWSFVILGIIFHDYPVITILLVLSWMIGVPVYKIIKENKKLSIQRIEEKERKKQLKQQEEEFSKQKEEFLANVLKWDKDGVSVLSVKDKTLNQYNDVYFIGENFYLVSLKTHKATKGTLLFVNKEVCFISDTIVRSIPYSQTLQVQIGMFEIRFSSKKYNTPLSFFCHAENPYLSRLAICEAYAKWKLLNGAESKDFMDDLTSVLNLSMEDAQQVLVHKED